MTREELQLKAKEQIDVLFSKINELEEKSDAMAADARAEIADQVSHLKQKKEAIETKLKGLTEVAEDKWDGFSSEFSEMLGGIKGSIGQFWNKMTK